MLKKTVIGLAVAAFAIGMAACGDKKDNKKPAAPKTETKTPSNGD